MEDCIFCKIIKKEIESEIVYTKEKFIAFKDVNPKAPIHILIVPKKHIASINHLKKEDRAMIGELFLEVKKIAEKIGIKEKGYKLVFNVGRGGGQIIDHLHLHLLGGWESVEKRDIPQMP